MNLVAMRVLDFTFLVLGVLGLGSAQDFGGVPSCAVSLPINGPWT